MDYTIIGSAVNLASRIESRAEPGAIYISEETYLLVKNDFDCVQASTVTLKGFGQPIQLYKVETNDAQEEPITVNNEGFLLKFQPSHMTNADRKHLKDVLEDIVNKL